MTTNEKADTPLPYLPAFPHPTSKEGRSTYACIFNLLFKPSPALGAAFEEQQRQMFGRALGLGEGYTAVHLRLGKLTGEEHPVSPLLYGDYTEDSLTQAGGGSCPAPPGPPRPAACMVLGLLAWARAAPQCASSERVCLQMHVRGARRRCQWLKHCSRADVEQPGCLPLPLRAQVIASLVAAREMAQAAVARISRANDTPIVLATDSHELRRFVQLGFLAGVVRRGGGEQQ